MVISTTMWLTLQSLNTVGVCRKVYASNLWVNFILLLSYKGNIHDYSVKLVSQKCRNKCETMAQGFSVVESGESLY